LQSVIGRNVSIFIKSEPSYYFPEIEFDFSCSKSQWDISMCEYCVTIPVLKANEKFEDVIKIGLPESDQEIFKDKREIQVASGTASFSLTKGNALTKVTAKNYCTIYGFNPDEEIGSMQSINLEVFCAMIKNKGDSLMKKIK